MALLSVFPLADGENTHRGCTRITVDPSGHDSFTTVQSAINSIPSGNSHWTCVDIKSGIYKEKVTIPIDKPYVFLNGGGLRNTYIAWNDHDSIIQSPTLTVHANNFKAAHISFMNTYNIPWSKSGNPRVQAVAAMIAGDKCSFYRCGFFGLQDTLWDNKGRHYFHFCTIAGVVDFIFGAGQSIYESCTIKVLGNALDPGSKGFITAQGRSSPNEGNGFVFKGGSVVGTGLSYLGRPWRDYARVLFYNTTMSNIIEPSGWDPWNAVGHEKQLTLAEYACHGPGSDMSKRVWWEKKMSWPEVKKLVDISFIDTEGWIINQPV